MPVVNTPAVGDHTMQLPLKAEPLVRRVQLLPSGEVTKLKVPLVPVAAYRLSVGDQATPVRFPSIDDTEYHVHDIRSVERPKWFDPPGTTQNLPSDAM